MPEEFLEKKLKNLIDIRSGYTWGKEQESSNPVKGSVRVLTVSNIQQELDLSSELYLMNVPEKEKIEKKAERGWSIAVGSNGNRKRIGNAVYINNDDEYLFASFLVGFKPKPESGLHPRYFYQWLTSYPVQERITVVSEGTTGLGNLNIRHFRNMRIQYPKKYSEQEAIVKIFETLDEALKATQNSIAQAQRLKKALMQHLLSGRLKPDGTWRKPDEFYVDEKFGRVPKGWNYLRLRDVLNSQLEYGANTSAIPYSKDFPRFIRITDIDDAGNLLEDTKVSLDPEIAKSYMLEENDFLFARTGNSVGRTFLYKNAYGPSAFAGYLVRAKLNQSLILPEYLNNLCLSQYFDSFKVSMARVGAKPNINAREFSNFRFILPERIDEQDQIAKSIYQFTFLIEAKTRKINYLIKIKKSLMQNLLTGKIRVQAE